MTSRANIDVPDWHITCWEKNSRFIVALLLQLNYFEMFILSLLLLLILLFHQVLMISTSLLFKFV